MVPKPSKFGTTAAKTATPRLAVPKLKVRSSNLKASEQNPCLDLMTAVLGCWASNGQTSAVCLNLEQQLRICMDSKERPKVAKSSINKNLARFYDSFRGPKKVK